MSELHLKQRLLDLWTLPNDRLTSTLATEIEENFYARCPPELRPDLAGSQSSGPPASAKKEEARSESVPPSTPVEDKEKQEGGMDITTTKWWSWFQMRPKTFTIDSAGNKQYDSSLLKALHRTFFIRWWTGGILLLLAGEFHCTIFLCQTLMTRFVCPSCTDTLQTTSPLVNKVILTWLTDAYVYHRLTDEQKATGHVKQPQGIGYGIGLAFALFAMQGPLLLYNSQMLYRVLTGFRSVEISSLVRLLLLHFFSVR